jgi:hydroxymethylpyrimidine pyrophosphatase-like HAD family hydrolase
MTVGNDYNDLDLLEMTPHPFVVANAPEELAGRFSMVPDNDHDGAARAITAWIDRVANTLNI